MSGNDERGGGRTIIRPSPGGAAGPRPDAAGPAPPRAAARSPVDPGSAPAARAASAAPAASPPADAAVEQFVARGANPILAAAGPLLSLGVTISSTSFQADVEALRARAVDAVKTFE